MVLNDRKTRINGNLLKTLMAAINKVFNGFTNYLCT